MTKEKKFSEMLHGDIKWMKEQEAVRSMLREEESEMTLIDTEAGQAVQRKLDDYIELLTSDLPSMSALRYEMGYGKRGLYTKRKMTVAQKMVAEINRRNPACAAELANGEGRDNYSFTFKTSKMRDWQKINWAYYYGMGKQWKAADEEFDEHSVMSLT